MKNYIREIKEKWWSLLAMQTKKQVVAITCEANATVPPDIGSDKILCCMQRSYFFMIFCCLLFAICCTNPHTIWICAICHTLNSNTIYDKIESATISRRPLEATAAQHAPHFLLNMYTKCLSFDNDSENCCILHNQFQIGMKNWTIFHCRLPKLFLWL